MLEEIREDLEKSEHKGKNKLKLVVHGEKIEFGKEHKDKDFKKAILGYD